MSEMRRKQSTRLIVIIYTALLLITAVMPSKPLSAEDCRVLASGTCTRRADMDIAICRSMNGGLVDSCFGDSRSEFQFQCEYHTESSKIAITYFDESTSEQDVRKECIRLSGKLTRLRTFVSRKPNLERGKLIYTEKGCSVCHGIRGEGDGPVSAALLPKATDFTKGFLYGDDLESIIRSISNGIPSTGMAPYTGVLEDYEIADVARYLRLFYKKKASVEKSK